MVVVRRLWLENPQFGAPEVLRRATALTTSSSHACRAPVAFDRLRKFHVSTPRQCWPFATGTRRSWPATARSPLATRSSSRTPGRSAASTTTASSPGSPAQPLIRLRLFSRFEAKLEQYRGNLDRSAVELAKDWRTDRMLRRLEAMLIVMDQKVDLPALGQRRSDRARRWHHCDWIRRRVRHGGGKGARAPHPT